VGQAADTCYLIGQDRAELKLAHRDLMCVRFSDVLVTDFISKA
jgi:hypothetical protein